MNHVTDQRDIIVPEERIMAQIGVLPPGLKRGEQLRSRMWEGKEYPYLFTQVRPKISERSLKGLRIEYLKFGG